MAEPKQLSAEELRHLHSMAESDMTIIGMEPLGPLLSHIAWLEQEMEANAQLLNKQVMAARAAQSDDTRLLDALEALPYGVELICRGGVRKTDGLPTLRQQIKLALEGMKK